MTRHATKKWSRFGRLAFCGLTGGLALGALLHGGPAPAVLAAPQESTETSDDETPKTDPAAPPLRALGDETEPDAATPADPERVILYVNRKETFAGVVAFEDDDIIVVRGRNNELRSYQKHRVRQICRLVDPKPGQQGVVHMRQAPSREGEILEDTFDRVVVRVNGIEHVLDREVVDYVELRPPFEEQYAKLKSSIQPNQHQRRLTLCRWLFEQKRYRLAQREIVALERDAPTLAGLVPLRRLIDAQVALLDDRETAPAARPTTPAGDTPINQRPGRDVGPVNAADLMPDQILTSADVNIIRVYEIDFDNPPRLQVDADTRRAVLEKYGSRSVVPVGQAARDRLLRGDAEDFTRLIFALRAREFYPQIQVLTEPEALNRFRLDVHDAWLINGCASTRCHGGVHAGELFLHRRNSKQPRVRYTNFLILERLETDPDYPLINYDEPLMSLIVQYGLPRAEARRPHPNVEGWRPIFRRSNRRLLDKTIEWINAMYIPRPEYPVEFEPPRMGDPEPTEDNRAFEDPKPAGRVDR